jgi:hypothetical protein
MCEPPEQFIAREQFYQRILPQVGPDLANTLSMVWRNIKYLGCVYNGDVDKRIRELDPTLPDTKTLKENQLHDRISKLLLLARPSPASPSSSPPPPRLPSPRRRGGHKRREPTHRHRRYHHRDARSARLEK